MSNPIPQMYRQPLVDFARRTAEKLGLPPEGKSAKGKGGNYVFFFARRNGKLDLGVEYYLNESYGGDDGSFTGFALPHQPGYERVRAEITSADTLDALIALTLAN